MSGARRHRADPAVLASSPRESGALGLTRSLASSSPFVFGLLLFAGAVLIRLLVTFWLRDLHAGPPMDPSADEFGFNHFAETLARGQGYVDIGGAPSSFRAPGFPLLLAVVYRIFGVNYAIARVTLCMLGGLAAVAAWILGRRFLGERGGRLVGVLTAVFIGHVWFSTVFLSEALAALLLIVGLWLFIRFLDRGSLVWLALSGLVLGYCALTRPFGLLFLPFYGLILLLRRQTGVLAALAPLVVFGLAFIAVIVPWTVRNYEAHGHFVLIATNGGSTFYGSNNGVVSSRPRLFGYWVSTVGLPGRNEVEAEPTEYDHDQKEWKLGEAWVQAHPARAALMVPFKLARLGVGLPEFNGGHRYYLWLRIAGYAPYFLFMVLGFGVVLTSRNYWPRQWLVVLLPVQVNPVTAAIFSGLPAFPT